MSILKKSDLRVDQEKAVQHWKKELDMDPDQFARVEKLLLEMDALEVARPFIVRDLRRGTGRLVICKKWNITRGTMRGIGIRAGIFKPKRW